MYGRIARGPLARPAPDRPPQNRRLPLRYRHPDEAGAEPAAHGELARHGPLAQVEAVLLAADEPLHARRLALFAGLSDAMEARRLVRKLQALYDRDGTAFQVEELAGGFQLLTRPAYHPWLLRLRRTGNDLRLSPAARETLAIVAYRQPIMRADIEAVRGVQCGEVLRLLMEKGLVRIAGRHDSLGRPVLYGTTKKFLQVFGLKSLRDLPLVEHLQPPEKAAPQAEEPGAPK
ncbi:MAG TPA: SMC-Scp complex subunit ScpB [Gemmataceae bacterium]|jgi:segregation and condensation protein B|nr:SMC-Scp complex subunit ScpB [Gemmataceae bacterium]